MTDPTFAELVEVMLAAMVKVGDGLMDDPDGTIFDGNRALHPNYYRMMKAKRLMENIYTSMQIARVLNIDLRKKAQQIKRSVAKARKAIIAERLAIVDAANARMAEQMAEQRQ